MHTIKTWRDPYDDGWATTKKEEIDFKPGITILVGCNGIGKSTLLRNIKSQLEEENIPYYMFDNLKDGGRESIDRMIHEGKDLGTVARMLSASEGENISNNLGIMARKLWKFIVSGENDNKNFDDIFNPEKSKKVTSKERWILLDAVDSGYSIDNVVDLKSLFDLVLGDAKKMDCEVYVIASANEYELAADMDCLDVAEGEYVTFSDYEDFRTFILESRNKKNVREK